MPRYMVQATYTADAVAAFASQPQDRRAGLEALLQRLGAQIESFDFCLGLYDIVVIFTAPDDATAVAIGLAAQAPGHLKTYQTTKLISADEFMEAQRKAQGAGYQGPSRT